MLFSLYLQHTAEARTQLEDATYCNIKADKHPLEMENKLSSVRKSVTHEIKLSVCASDEAR